MDNYFVIIVGTYYIDPNGGSWTDGFKVMCDFEDGACTTCIDADNMVNFNLLSCCYANVCVTL